MENCLLSVLVLRERFQGSWFFIYFIWALISWFSISWEHSCVHIVTVAGGDTQIPGFKNRIQIQKPWIWVQVDVSYPVTLSPLSFMFAVRHMETQFLYRWLTAVLAGWQSCIFPLFTLEMVPLLPFLLLAACLGSMVELHIFLRTLKITYLFINN